MIDKKELLDRYVNGLGSDGKTRSLYLRYAREFLEYSDGSFDRNTILKYMEKLRREKYSDGTRNFVFRVIRTIYNRSLSMLTQEGIEWPFRRGETPQIREDRIVAPALDPDLIIEMIIAVKEEGTPPEKAFLSLFTTYGLRREEGLNLTEEDVLIKDRAIHIDTLKHGRERTHRIPDEIVPALSSYDFSTSMSEFGLLAIWYQIERRINFNHVAKVGPHSIRRTLNTLLLDELSQNVVMSFLRWKQRTSSNMPYRYSAQKFVGRESTATKVVGEAKDVDDKVFAVHPFIKYWKE